jgi:hypothetical protein
MELVVRLGSINCRLNKSNRTGRHLAAHATIRSLRKLCVGRFIVPCKIARRGKEVL